MMNTVPAANILAMAVSLVLSVGLPVALFIVLKVKTKAKVTDLLLGAVTFVLFAMVLEQLLHTVMYGVFGEKLTGNRWLYAIYGGIAAAVFEECGRLVTMKFFLKKRLNRETALMYGVGHGGIEALLIGGLACISNLATVALINGGGLEATLAGLDETAQASFMTTVSQLCTLPPYMFLMVGMERVTAVVLQIALSYLVYLAVRYHRWGFFAAAMGIHFAVDAVTVILSSCLPIPALEAILMAAVAVIAFLSARLYREEAAEAQI